ncbi:MAG: M6 family metalloprotease domain-containing protein, partial [Salinivirgaceae bacterium]|nr:M6 family metalloprotease domain-containing protein [Salinivirgaceae bacterium]
MKQPIKQLIIAFLILFAINNLQAVPAYPGLIQQTQSDGATLNYYLHGDEHFSFARTTDGYTILRNKQGDYVYMIHDLNGDLVQSSIIAHNPDARTTIEKAFVTTLETKMFFSNDQMALIAQIIDVHKKETYEAKAFPTTGDRKLICILMQFPDRTMNKTQSDFHALFNTVGYNVGSAIGSVKDYYLENSCNQFNLTVDVAGPYTSTHNMATYGGESGNPRLLAREAVLAADADVNFAEYDNDNDGSVDGMYMIFAGYGREAGASSTTIWSHAWNITPAVYVDGKQVSRYSCSPELRGSSGSNITNIGVICHEFGHVLGAPDYYDTDYADGGQYPGTGNWDLMAGGSWNGNGATPAHHNGYTKVKIYNWATANILTQPTSITLEAAEFNTNSYYQINTTTGNEYYLIENRQKQGFDIAVPGQGMMIYHIHRQIAYAGNALNATHPQKMYPVCASANQDPTSSPESYGDVSSAGCPWPYSTKTEFSDQSLPSSKSWAGNNTNKPITNITRNYTLKTVSFDFMGGEGNPMIFEATSLSNSEVRIVWDHTTVNHMVIGYSETGIFGNLTSGTTYQIGDIIPGGGEIIYAGTDTSFIHSALNSSTAYFYKVWARKNTVPEYSSGITAYAYTNCAAVNQFPFVENFGTQEQPPCFNVNDNLENTQVWQFDNPQNRPFQSTTAANGFVVLDSEFYGSGNEQNTDLETGIFDFSEYQTVNVSFEHYYNHRNSEGVFSFSIDGGENYTPIHSFVATVGTFAAPALASFNVSSQVAGHANVRFKWNYTASFGIYWLIDDFTVSAQDRIAMQITHNDNTYNNGNKIIDYAVTNAGSSKIYELHIQSVGDLPLTLSNPTVNSPKYSVTTNPSGTIAPGESSMFTITYTPTVAGTDTVVVTLGNNTPTNNPFTFVIKSNVSNQFDASFTINDGENPVAGATVEIVGYTAQTTNGSGVAIIENVTAGTEIAYTISKTGHIPSTGTIMLIDADENYDIMLPRTDVAILFHLKNDAGNNILNSDVTIP